MIFRVIREEPETSQIKDLLHNLNTEQFYFIERACQKERRERREQIFRQWQQFIAREISEQASQK